MFLKNTIESVIGDLLNKVELLHSLAEVHAQKAEQNLAKSAEHAKQAVEHNRLVEKAKKIAGNITALLS